MKEWIVLLMDGESQLRLRAIYDPVDYLNVTNRDFLAGEILIGKTWVRGAVAVATIQTVYEAT